MMSKLVKTTWHGTIEVVNTVDLDGKPVVCLYYCKEEVNLSPVEARRLGSALLEAAERVRAKVT